MNAYAICGYSFQNFDGTGLSCAGSESNRCCAAKAVGEEFRLSMARLKSQIFWWNGISANQAEDFTSARLLGCVSSVSECIPQILIANACMAPTQAKFWLLTIIRIVMSIVTLPLLFLTNSFLLAGVQAYIRQQSMLQHLDSMITPSIFVERA